MGIHFTRTDHPAAAPARPTPAPTARAQPARRAGRDSILDEHAEIVAGLAPYVLLEVAAVATGYSVKAMRRKIEEGIWQEGREWRKAPDGHVHISIEGYRRWVEQAPGLRSAKNRSASRSSTAPASRNATP